MPDPTQQLSELLRQDTRYRFEAYAFVFEALNFAQDVLKLGQEYDPATCQGGEGICKEGAGGEKHVTGQELCEAVRQFALEQFGYMAKTVLNSWGICKTGDFGEIVFNLIRIGQMRKTDRDRREDFDDVFDFEMVFKKEFKITVDR